VNSYDLRCHRCKCKEYLHLLGKLMSLEVLDQPLEEKVVTLLGVSWDKFKAIEAPLENNRKVKLTYSAGVLEIMSPIGGKHEYVKRTPTEMTIVLRDVFYIQY
jgi:hypothetical protein